VGDSLSDDYKNGNNTFLFAFVFCIAVLGMISRSLLFTSVCSPVSDKAHITVIACPCALGLATPAAGWLINLLAAGLRL
jgi:cation transport ATPase